MDWDSVDALGSWLGRWALGIYFRSTLQSNSDAGQGSQLERMVFIVSCNVY
jgi:hypothetical protein